MLCLAWYWHVMVAMSILCQSTSVFLRQEARGGGSTGKTRRQKHQCSFWEALPQDHNPPNIPKQSCDSHFPAGLRCLCRQKYFRRQRNNCLGAVAPSRGHDGGGGHQGVRVTQPRVDNERRETNDNEAFQAPSWAHLASRPASPPSPRALFPALAFISISIRIATSIVAGADTSPTPAAGRTGRVSRYDVTILSQIANCRSACSSVHPVVLMDMSVPGVGVTGLGLR